MATMPSEPMDLAHELDALCRWGIRAAWHLSLAWGALVSLLSWTSGAAAATAVVRGLVTFVAFGLVGWGVNAVMVQAGHQAGDLPTDKHRGGAVDDESAATDRTEDMGLGMTTPRPQPESSGTREPGPAEGSDAVGNDARGEARHLAEAAS